MLWHQQKIWKDTVLILGVTKCYKIAAFAEFPAKQEINEFKIAWEAENKFENNVRCRKI